VRMVSWIVVLGALAWLLYVQLGPRLSDEKLPGIPPGLVSGAAMDPAAAGDEAATPDGDRTTAPDSGDDASDGAGAALPYAGLYPMLQATNVVAGLDRIEATAIVKSRRPDVQPEDIVLTLEDGERSHHFPVGQYGEVNLPLREDWRDDDRVLRANQPADSLDFQVTFIMRALPGPRVEYAWLWESMQQMDEALEALGALNGGPARDVVGVLFEFAPGAEGVLRAGDRASDAVLRADEAGVIRLEMDRALLDENPTLAFSPMPERMLPLLASDRDEATAGGSPP